MSLDYQSATLHFGYLLRRNVRVVAEGTYIFSGQSVRKSQRGVCVGILKLFDHLRRSN